MTTAPAPRGRIATAVPDDLSEEDLAPYLPPSAFPAGQNELQATLIRNRAPSRLLWRLVALSPSRRYASLAEVMDDVTNPAVPQPVREPI